MAPGVRLDHAVVHVSDWERSNAFYRHVLGAELVRAGARWSYRFGDQQLNLHGPGVEATPVAKIQVPPGGSDLCFEWPDNLQGLFREARESIGFVPNVFRAYSYRPERLSAWFAHLPTSRYE